ncbi:uncharacterized protein [Dermacentor albipictus]|uniref:uncharacterized protein isoform X2 n=1 Tax=Dermacentor albipictus TaxID=60249 RepID=UPI0038FCC8B1
MRVAAWAPWMTESPALKAMSACNRQPGSVVGVSDMFGKEFGVESVLEYLGIEELFAGAEVNRLWQSVALSLLRKKLISVSIYCSPESEQPSQEPVLDRPHACAEILRSKFTRCRNIVSLAGMRPSLLFLSYHADRNEDGCAHRRPLAAEPGAGALFRRRAASHSGCCGCCLNRWIAAGAACRPATPPHSIDGPRHRRRLPQRAVRRARIRSTARDRRRPGGGRRQRPIHGGGHRQDHTAWARISVPRPTPSRWHSRATGTRPDSSSRPSSATFRQCWPWPIKPRNSTWTISSPQSGA